MCLTALFIFAYVYYFIVVLQIYHKIPNNQKNSLFLKRLVSAFSNIEKYIIPLLYPKYSLKIKTILKKNSSKLLTLFQVNHLPLSY